MQPANTSHQASIEPGITRWLIVFAVMLVAVIEVIDMTIVNVALTPLMGALGATSDQVTWVLTSYIVAAAIVMPLTGFLVDIIGRKRLLLIDIVGFMIASILCGLSTSLSQMVLFRVLQGLFGASLIPLSQYILIDTFPPQDRNKIMAVWAMGIMAGPIMGPTLGGYLIDTFNWRWIFFINPPFCLVAFFMALQTVKETPIKKLDVDWLGLFLMAFGIGCLQIMLDRGQTEDWFASPIIIVLAISSLISLMLFLVRGIPLGEKNIINLTLFANSNFSISAIMLVLFSMGFFGIIALQPIMVQNIMQYPASTTGLLMAPRGLTSMLGMIIVGRFGSWLDLRLFLCIGLLISIITTYWMSQFNLEASFAVMAFVNFAQGLGIGFFMVPAATIAYSTLQSKYFAEGSGLANFSRSLGTSVGISLSSTYVIRKSQINWNYLASHLSSDNPYLQTFLQSRHWDMHSHQTIAYFSNQLFKQASMVAFVNTYRAIAIIFFLIFPLIFLLKKPKSEQVHFTE